MRRHARSIASILPAALLAISASTASANDWQMSGNNIFFTGGNVGIGTSTPAFPFAIRADGPARAVSAINDTATGTVYGLWAQTLSPSGRGAIGFANATTGTAAGFYGQSNSILGRGVVGLANASSGQAYGVLGQTNSVEGRGVYGLATTTTGENVGVFGQANGETGTGVAGFTQTAAIGGNTIGVSGIANSENAVGVIGRGNGDPTGQVYGVVGVTSTTNGFGVFSNGDTGASGTKNFVIDHPTDPEHKFLVHYSAESPEPYLIYRGTAMLDETGAAVVSLPDYFDELNRDPQYQLTAIGAPAPYLHIAEKVENNRFVIAGGVPGMEVSWTVTGIRNDRWVQANPPAVERVKPASAQGKYFHPELYGKPANMGIFFQPLPKLAAPTIPVTQFDAMGVSRR